jgi:uncharacterized protein
LRSRIVIFIATVQSILLLAHWFIYQTWTSLRGAADPPGISGLQAAMALLSVSFVLATLLAHRYINFPVRLFYRTAAAWLGFVNFLFVAAGVSWLVYIADQWFKLRLAPTVIVTSLFGSAIGAGLLGFANARWVRIKRITIPLPNLPQSWRGRVAALVSDVHLGHVNGAAFLRRIVSRLRKLAPDIIFITGDLYDGTKVHAGSLAAPWKEISPALGTYFVTGNHEEFSDPTKYLDGVRKAGVRVLKSESVVVDGLQIVGVDFRDSTRPDQFRSILKSAALERDRPSILLSHAPHALEVAEEAGISLQLSGHTHGGQIFPFTWFTRRIFGAFTYGLAQFGKMKVYTSSGAGTWGPPMRLGTRPEIVLIEFD